jgi:hypothetical protein
MASYELGQAAIVNKGAWSSAASYVVLNTVTHNGGSFMAIAANSSKEPGVSSDWATYWVNMAKGIKTVDIVADSTSTAHAVFTMSDGTTITGTTFTTSPVADGSITDAKIVSTGISRIANGAVTAAMLGSDILPINVGIKHGDHNPPTTSDISDGQIYLYHA